MQTVDMNWHDMWSALIRVLQGARSTDINCDMSLQSRLESNGRHEMPHCASKQSNTPPSQHHVNKQRAEDTMAYTSVVTEISYHTAVTIDAEGVFHLEAEWREELIVLLDDVKGVRGKRREELTMLLDDIKAEGNNPKVICIDLNELGMETQGVDQRHGEKQSEKETQQDRPKDMAQINIAFDKLPGDMKNKHSRGRLYQWQKETQQDRPKDMTQINIAFDKLPGDLKNEHSRGRLYQWQTEGENP
ncbi:hypothetical protein C8R48DRAFT_680486 [Suillus tomentosus]|nr:hypothetical protein C8R48DRAFT_680486 [Suillus tomentosus]